MFADFMINSQMLYLFETQCIWTITALDWWTGRSGKQNTGHGHFCSMLFHNPYKLYKMDYQHNATICHSMA